MPTPNEIKKSRDLNNGFLVGEKILGIKFRHNSLVAFQEGDIRVEGWIVGVGPIEPEPIYTVERCDGGGDEEVPQSRIELIADPHEKSKS
jgi:hypothetical protein